MKKRKSLKKVLLTHIIAYVAIIIIVITAVSIYMQTKKIRSLTESVLGKESVSYANAIDNWWSNVEQRVLQTAAVLKASPDLSYDDALKMLLQLTEADPDSQDIYIGYGDDNKFLDGSGWTPDSDFVFTDRPWYIGAIDKKGEIFTSEPYVDASTGKTCLACAVMLRDKVVLSSDINFDKVLEQIQAFQSSSEDAKYYLVNKETKDILLSSVGDIAGQKLGECQDATIQGLNTVFDSLNTALSVTAEKVETASTDDGSMMYSATDIEGTSWVIVSAVPRSFMSDSIVTNMVITIAVGVGLLILLAVILFIVISRNINPVAKVTERVTDISDGNFAVRLNPTGNTEITTLSEKMNSYIDGMRATLSDMTDVSESMSASATHCYDISQNLTSANQSQGDSIEKLNTTLGSMSQSIDDVAHSATELATTSGELMESAEDIRSLCETMLESSASGKDEMSHVTQNVTTLERNIAELAEIIRVAARSIEEITGITDTINAISEQTNLLSLNASIEAARAGEQGKGFAVVASEVGVLAQQSTDATETIRQLIQGITKNIEDINTNAETCVKDMEACVEGVKVANTSFDQIYTNVEKATEGIVSITGGIERINDFASSNAATTQEQASSISEVLGLSDNIVDESNKLREQTDSISHISEDLNRYSSTLRDNLSKYEL
ncbi:MAG: methyl-accepting chemotaxis protein [Eubacterium sp.]|nr:methyl-accepting chemotaxis protein [Eubacterium sp.]